MKAYDLAELAVRNLRESVLRNSLTTVGISVGVASLVAMLSLGIGLQQLATRRLVRSRACSIPWLSPRGAICATSIAARMRAVSIPRRARFSTNLRVRRLSSCLTCMEAYPDLRFITSFTYDDKPHLTMVAGVPSSDKTNDAFEGLQGSFFSSDTAPEVILQKIVCRGTAGQDAQAGRRRGAGCRTGQAAARQRTDDALCRTRRLRLQPPTDANRCAGCILGRNLLDPSHELKLTHRGSD